MSHDTVTVAELRDALEGLPANMPVAVGCCQGSDTAHSVTFGHEWIEHRKDGRTTYTEGDRDPIPGSVRVTAEGEYGSYTDVRETLVLNCDDQYRSMPWPVIEGDEED